MANVYKVTHLDMVNVADAIRLKGGTTGQLVFPSGFITAISNLSGSGSGATLTVTTPAGGVTVTVTNGKKTYTKTSSANGTAVFSGLETGTWTITINNGLQTTTGSINIYNDYATKLTFFSATINITYPAGSICKVTNGVITLTAPNTSGTWACVVPNTGTWTVTATYGSKSKSGNVTITTDGQTASITLDYTLKLFYDGNQCSDQTGGWSLYYSWTPSGSDINGHYGIVSNGIRIGLPFYSPNLWLAVEYATTNKIDVTNYNTLSFQVVDASMSWGIESSAFGLFTGTSSNYPNMAASANVRSTGTYEIDISNITGSYNIGGHMASIAQDSPGGYFIVNNVFLR